MPIIQFTQGDKLASLIMDKGIYPAVIKEIPTATASGSGKSVSYFVDITVTGEGKYAGKELRVAFNSGVSNRSMLGGLQFEPVRSFLTIYAAQKNMKMEEVPLEFDTDDIIGPIDIQVDHDTTDGQLSNIITAFLPRGSHETMKPVF